MPGTQCSPREQLGTLAPAEGDRLAVFAPLPSNATSPPSPTPRYLGYRLPPALWARAAPTWNDTADGFPGECVTPYRERQLQGEVSDGNAYAMGGVAGHAGLFASAAELHAFGAALLFGGSGGSGGGGGGGGGSGGVARGPLGVDALAA